MNHDLASFTRPQIRFACLGLLLVPFSTTLFAFAVDMGRHAAPPPPWLGIAKTGLIVVAVYCLVAPFAVERLVARSADRVRARGYDLKQMTLLICLGGSVGPLALAALLVLAGGPAAMAYWYAPLSLLSAAYWTWRYRKALVTSAVQ